MVRLDPLEEDMGRTPPQTEDTKERGFPTDKDHGKDRGTSDTVEPEPEGDIADEGSAHRG